MKVFVYIDQFDGKALNTSWETIGAAQTLGEVEIHAVSIGFGLGDVSTEAFSYGVSAVHIADHPSLKDYDAALYADILADAVKANQPDVVILPTSTRGNELAAMLAVDLETGVLVDVIDLDASSGKVKATRPIYAGKALSVVECDASPVIITIRNRAFPAPEKGTAPYNAGLALAPGEDRLTTTTGYEQAEGGVSLTDANVIVSGGRGAANTSAEPPADLDEASQELWKAEQGFKLISELADALNGAVGASRAAVDANYISYEHQVGQTGKIVSPDLYIAAGISGAIQHLAGMRSSKVLVAINKDADAPIFKYAKYGVAEDLFTFLPALTAAFKAKLR